MGWSIVNLKNSFQIQCPRQFFLSWQGGTDMNNLFVCTSRDASVLEQDIRDRNCSWSLIIGYGLGGPVH